MPDKFEFNFQMGQTGKNVFEVIAEYRNIPKEDRVHKDTAYPVTDDVKIKSKNAFELMNNSTQQRYALQKNETLIGRDEGCHIVLNDPTVSYLHARVCRQYGKVIVEDLGSTNGTRVNGERITKKILKEGDRIKMGEVELVLNF